MPSIGCLAGLVFVSAPMPTVCCHRPLHYPVMYGSGRITQYYLIHSSYVCVCCIIRRRCDVTSAGLAVAGPFAMGMGLMSAGLAASNLLLDFDFIQKASYQGLPKWMEWYSAQSVMITLVWMYTEVLRLLMMFSGMRRDD